MAQNITLLGASYSDVPSVTLPKTGGGTASFDDTTDATATASDIAQGKTAYANGVKIVGTASGGGGDVAPLYSLGLYYSALYYTITVNHNHIKIDSKSSSGQSCNVRGTVLNNPTWFSIPSGSEVVVKYYNVVNPDNITWNANAKRAGTETSLSYGVGNGTHLNGETLTVTTTTSEDIGCWFIYISSTAGKTLEFDMSVTVNGVRYI